MQTEVAKHTPKKSVTGTELIQRETHVPAIKQEQAWGTEGIDMQDVVIPKLLLMQGQSAMIAERKAQLGDIVRSNTKEVLGGPDKPVEIIPLSTFKTWVKSQEYNGKYEYRGIEPVTAQNVDDPLEWTEKVEGKTTKWRRDRSLNFYVLLASDIAREAKALKTGEMNPNDALIPCVISFRRTSYGAGRDLITHFAKAAHFNQPPARSTFKLTSRSDKNDKGTFHVFGIEAGHVTSAEDLAVCKRWYDTIRGTKVVVDDSDLKEPVRASHSEASAIDDLPF